MDEVTLLLCLSIANISRNFSTEFCETAGTVEICLVLDGPTEVYFEVEVVLRDDTAIGKGTLRSFFHPQFSIQNVGLITVHVWVALAFYELQLQRIIPCSHQLYSYSGHLRIASAPI